MALLSWDDVASSPEFQNTARSIENSAARQFKAIPGADPRIRQAAMAIAERRGRVQDMNARLTDQHAIRNRELDLTEREMKRTERRRPIGLLLGLGAVGVQGLSSFADYRRFKQSEVAAGQQQALFRDIGGVNAEVERLKARQLSELGALYR